ncbi:MAG: T9SS type A sorting domain-containing protein [Bacteroidota bacterium]
MKRHTTLFLLLFSFSAVFAQDTIRSLVITEARMDDPSTAYVEFTNLGEEAIDLSAFEFGRITMYDVEYGDDTLFILSEDEYMMLPDEVLEPGESYLIAAVEDWYHEQYVKNPFENTPGDSKPDIIPMADMVIHVPEAGYNTPEDSVSDTYKVMEVNGTCFSWYLRHHLSNGDSVLVDQVGTPLYQDDDPASSRPILYVAGVKNAMDHYILSRKYDVKTGNPDFAIGRGTTVEDSEWMLIPFQPDAINEKATYWTVGNHGNYGIDESTLTSEVLDINWNTSTITVPWGIQRGDSLVFLLDKREGLAWQYRYVANHYDSIYLSVQSGDEITFYAVGESLIKKTFILDQAEPAPDNNKLIPRRLAGEDGYYGYIPEGEHATFFSLKGDTILHPNGITGLPFRTRADSIFKYLEIPENATCEIIFADEEEDRADLVEGDILRVTSENGNTKDYYIKVDDYRPAGNAFLSAIIWPDSPEDYKNAYGWQSDTIPGFAPDRTHYRLRLPHDHTGIPALVAMPDGINAWVEVELAENLVGTPEQRTIKFRCIAEDSMTIKEYKVTLEKDKLSENQQAPSLDPFLSQVVFHDQWANSFFEICNPNDVPLDLSDYMLVHTYATTPDSAIRLETDEDADTYYLNRFRKYIPGYKWQERTIWDTQPYLAEPDEVTDPMVYGSDVFVLTKINSEIQSTGHYWPARDEWDIDFANNPWAEPVGATVTSLWNDANFYIFRILNDSIKEGLKPATDPADFKLIETWGSGENTTPAPVGEPFGQLQSYIRKPQYTRGHPEFGASYANNPEESEWIMTDLEQLQNEGYGWPDNILMITKGIGYHAFDEFPSNKSTIASVRYRVSPGYSNHEEIQGIFKGTTVDEFLKWIIKLDPGQELTIRGHETGDTLVGEDELSTGDSLIVLSADQQNRTKYLLELTAQLLVDPPVLTSEVYAITFNPPGRTASIMGMQYTTSLTEVLNNLIIPAGVRITVLDEKGRYLPTKMLTSENQYQPVFANDHIFFEQISEDVMDTFMYQLLPDTPSHLPFVTSYVYDIDQDQQIIEQIPPGTTVATLLRNLIIPRGITVQVYDKNGLPREQGKIYKDDLLVATAADGETKKTYYLANLGLVPPWPEYYTEALCGKQAITYRIQEYDFPDYYIYKGITFTDSTFVPEDGDTIFVEPLYFLSGYIVDILPVPELNLPKDTTIYESITLDAGTGFLTYEWNTGYRNPELEIDFEAYDLGGHLFWVEVTNEFGCTTRDTIRVTLAEPSYIDGMLAEQAVRIYPNPTTGKVRIDLKNKTEKMEIAVFALNGNLLLKKKYLNTSGAPLILDISNLKNGMYLLQMKTNDMFHHERIILEKH